MIEKGTIFLFQPNDSDKPIKYVVVNEYRKRIWRMAMC